jgi:hypothetical protein
LTHHSPPPTLVSMLTPLILTFFCTGVDAAEITTLPQAMGGEVSLTYQTDQARLPLEESGESVGKVGVHDHLVTLSLAFSVLNDLSVRVEIPGYVLSRVSYEDSHLMAWDPTEETGSLLSGADESFPSIDGKGPGGSWFSLLGRPLSEARGHQATWLLEVGLRNRTKQNFWTENGDKRGAGPGAAAQRLVATFATIRGPASPYLQMRLLRQGAIDVELANGKVTIEPEQSATLSAGSEFFHYENTEKGMRISSDYRVAFGYHSDAHLPSGLLIPDVLPSSAGQAINQGEYTSLQSSAGLNWQFTPEIKAQLNGSLGWLSPTRLEHPYPIYTDNSLTWGISTTVTYLVR